MADRRVIHLVLFVCITMPHIGYGDDSHAIKGDNHQDGIPQVINTGYQLFINEKRVLHRPGWSSKKAIENVLAITKKYPNKKVEGYYHGERIMIDNKGHELFWNGKRVGLEPNWTRKQSQRNFRWNLDNHPDKEVVVLYNGVVLRPPSRLSLLPEWKRCRSALDQMYQIQEFRLFYTLKGRHALSRDQQVDRDNNGTPDYIEDIGLQFVTAKLMYEEVLQLRHPFEGSRYKGRVKYFDINIGDIPFDGKGSYTACAGSAVVNYYREVDPKEGVNVLTIDLSHKSSANGLNPAHELFHEYQYGYTMFKNPWYLEGMARLSESLFNQVVPQSTLLPANGIDRDRLFEMDYGGYRFWHTILQAVDSKGTFIIPLRARNLRYKTNNRSIIQDNRFAGAQYLRLFLEEMDRMDNIVSEIRSLDPINWPDSVQKSPDNNIYVWMAALRACQRLSEKSSLLHSFVKQFAQDIEQPKNNKVKKQ